MEPIGRGQRLIASQPRYDPTVDVYDMHPGGER